VYEVTVVHGAGKGKIVWSGPENILMMSFSDINKRDGKVFNSYVKFHAKICMHCEMSTKITEEVHTRYARLVNTLMFAAFLPRCMECKRGSSDEKAVCPSVHPSVRQTRGS